jgi:hypothetical protein
MNLPRDLLCNRAFLVGSAKENPISLDAKKKNTNTLLLRFCHFLAPGSCSSLKIQKEKAIKPQTRR